MDNNNAHAFMRKMILRIKKGIQVLLSFVMQCRIKSLMFVYHLYFVHQVYRVELHFFIKVHCKRIISKRNVLAYLSIYVKFDMQPIQIFKSPWQRTGSLLVIVVTEQRKFNMARTTR